MARHIAGRYGGVEWEGRVARDGEPDACWELRFKGHLREGWHAVPFVPVFGSDQAAVERIVGWFGELAEQYDAVLFQQSLEDLSRVESGAELFHWAALALPKFHNSPHHPEVLAQLQAKSKELLRHGSPTSRRSRQVPRGDSE